MLGDLGDLNVRATAAQTVACVGDAIAALGQLILRATPSPATVVVGPTFPLALTFVTKRLCVDGEVWAVQATLVAVSEP